MLLIPLTGANSQLNFMRNISLLTQVKVNIIMSPIYLIFLKKLEELRVRDIKAWIWKMVNNNFLK